MQYHFVVMYDEETDTFEYDSITTDIKFNDEYAYDPESGKWHNSDELMESDYEDYLSMLQEKLGK